MKTEPSTFSIEDLARAPRSTTSWDGVRNFQARNNLRAMKKGDLVLMASVGAGFTVGAILLRWAI